MTDPANLPNDFRRCVKCRHPKHESCFNTHHGEPTKTCTECLTHVAAKYHEDAEERDAAIGFGVVQLAYRLTDDEAHAVDLAAGQAIIRKTWKRRNEGRWPGPTAEAVVDAMAPDSEARRRHLLIATSYRAREMLREQGLDPGGFFHGTSV